MTLLRGYSRVNFLVTDEKGEHIIYILEKLAFSW